jgi:uroporphyrinogen-III synthase
MPSLKGRRVALLEARMSEEAASLVRRLGGAPYLVPAVREVVHPESVGPFIEALGSGRISLVLFLTGVGVAALLREAGRLDRLESTIAALRQTTVACRGPKPVAVLKRHSVPVHITAAEPYTTRELLDALAPIDLDGKSVALVHYGEPNEALTASLAARGAKLEELSIYEWQLPDDVTALQSLVRELIDGRVDAVAFTSQVQCRHLFQVAEELGVSGPLANALNTGTVVAAVGPVCAEALLALGVTPDVIPARPKMGPMITALAEYFDLTEGL